MNYSIKKSLLALAIIIAIQPVTAQAEWGPAQIGYTIIGAGTIVIGCVAYYKWIKKKDTKEEVKNNTFTEEKNPQQEKQNIQIASRHSSIHKPSEPQAITNNHPIVTPFPEQKKPAIKSIPTPSSSSSSDYADAFFIAGLLQSPFN